MEFFETRLKGAWIVQVKKIQDERGFFARGWCRGEFAEHGLNPGMVQLSVGHNILKGTLRGLHYQDPPDQEAKLVRCTRGAMYDVAVDIRPESPTCGQWVGVELTADNGTMLYSGEGFAHGYQTLLDETEMYYLTSAAYSPQTATGLRFDDPSFGIVWPLPVTVISSADRAWPAFARSGRERT
jgi:dTDP-4-dehydrorhamnose 3,5-epimerase